MKKQSNLSRLLEIAGSHKYLTYASWVLSAISALIALVPFYYIWKMIKEVLEVAPDFGQAQNLTGNGWMAVLFAVLAVSPSLKEGWGGVGFIFYPMRDARGLRPSGLRRG